ncbi:rhombosortase [Thaumasiovibrio subtropicus]|uniref:rhombosortase n=1 Tax=Thaumasiovibrio subtropicus TaxID=1891207 RepID=UPI00131BB198|nr:rhombosortase [Thaumasiovibrio subtropicus]
MAIYRYLVCMVLFLALMQIPAANEWAYWYRDAILSGEVWRILTGNLTHTNYWHLLMNSLALIMIVYTYQELVRPLKFSLLIAAISIVIGVAHLATGDYALAGLSGTLHGLLAWCAIQDIRECPKDSDSENHRKRRQFGWIVLIGLGIKIGYELLHGGNSVTADLINAQVAVDAHAIGALTGVIIGILPPPWHGGNSPRKK